MGCLDAPTRSSLRSRLIEGREISRFIKDHYFEKFKILVVTPTVPFTLTSQQIPESYFLLMSLNARPKLNHQVEPRLQLPHRPLLLSLSVVVRS